MKKEFSFTSVRQNEALPIALACIVLPLVLAWGVGQHSSAVVANELFPPGIISLIASSLLAGYWLIKKRALVEVCVELDATCLAIRYSSGQVATTALQAITEERYWVARGTHTLFIKTQNQELRLATNELFGGQHSASQFEAVVHYLRQLLRTDS